MSITLRSLGLFGVVLFGVLFLVTFSSPEVIEKSAKGFAKYQIEKEVNQRYQRLKDSNVAANAQALARNLGFESEQIIEDLKQDLPEKIARIVASMCGYDCEKQKIIAQSITASYLERLKNINIAQESLEDIVKGKYVEIIGNLKTDLRIFLGVNFILFAILLLLSFVKPQAMVHLFLPGIFLAIATVLSSAIYIFGQNWFYTILYNDYMGFAYLGYVAIIFGALVDIALNKARVSSLIINAIGSLLGSVTSVLPC
ncbi:hypothetical protein MAH1_12810 [Sessilibacter sp. MAH1]